VTFRPGAADHVAGMKSRARSFAPTLILSCVALAGASRLSAQEGHFTPVSRIVCVPEPAAGVCWSDYVDVPIDQFQIGSESDVYATFALDAVRPGCAEVAARRLEDRLRAALELYGGLREFGLRVTDPRSGKDVHPFQSWLAGAMMTHVFYAAWEFRRAGIVVDDGLLHAVEALYGEIPTPQDPGCGLRSLPWVNSCMDDFALTASGAAWIAAYETSVGRTADPSASLSVRWARSLVGAALSPMSDHGGGPCFFFLETLDDGTHRARCDGDAGTAHIMGADHNRENPGYGLGLMTSIASACAGLFYAGERCAFTDAEAFVSRELFRHAQEKSLPDGSAFAGPGPGGCLDFTDPDGPTKDCSDADTLVWSFGGYRPTDFPVRFFYGKRGVDGMAPPPAFQFDRYCEPRGSLQPGDFWGPSRGVYYFRLAYEIFQ
jgi:hypothetical protein